MQNKVKYKIESGIYSDKAGVSELEVISYKYPYAIFTMNSAYYYHSLTDVIPDKYYLATSKDMVQRKINIRQYPKLAVQEIKEVIQCRKSY